MITQIHLYPCIYCVYCMYWMLAAALSYYSSDHFRLTYFKLVHSKSYSGYCFKYRECA